MNQAKDSGVNIPVVFANWKMHKTLAETGDYFSRFLTPVKAFSERAEIFLLVPHTVLSLAAALTAGSGIHIGSQNHFWEDSGPYTGEISAAIVRDCGGKYALIGHYERRFHFGETLHDIRRKARAALRNELTPILCIGESIGERQAGETKAIIRKQIRVALKGFTPLEVARCYLLYEPYWAIGAEEPVVPSVAREAHGWIRQAIRETFGNQTAEKTRILYGGSVRQENVSEFLIQKDIDGVGIGRSGLEPEAFLKIIEAAASLFP
jgi:triosephosphate isomerase